jgi:hypothetical protein
MQALITARWLSRGTDGRPGWSKPQTIAILIRACAYRRQLDVERACIPSIKETPIKSFNY